MSVDITKSVGVKLNFSVFALLHDSLKHLAGPNSGHI